MERCVRKCVDTSLFHGMVMDGGAKRGEQEAGAGAGMKARLHGLEAISLVAPRLRHARGSPAWTRCASVGHQAQHALGAAAAGQGPARLRMGVGGRRAWDGRVRGPQPERAHPCLVPWPRSHPRQGPWGQVPPRGHGLSPAPSSPGAPGGARGAAGLARLPSARPAEGGRRSPAQPEGRRVCGKGASWSA